MSIIDFWGSRKVYDADLVEQLKQALTTGPLPVPQPAHVRTAHHVQMQLTVHAFMPHYSFFSLCRRSQCKAAASGGPRLVQCRCTRSRCPTPSTHTPFHMLPPRPNRFA